MNMTILLATISFGVILLSCIAAEIINRSF